MQEKIPTEEAAGEVAHEALPMVSRQVQRAIMRGVAKRSRQFKTKHATFHHDYAWQKKRRGYHPEDKRGDEQDEAGRTDT